MNDAIFFGFTSICYMLSMVFYIVYLIYKKDVVGRVASYLAYFGFFLHSIGFLVRWYKFSFSFSLPLSQSIPITNLYESLLFFAWCIILGNIFIELRFKTRLFGFLITAIAGMAIAFVDAIGANKIVQPILPALKSNWLLAHASLSFVAYAAFSLSFAASILNLAFNITDKRNKIYTFWVFSLSIFIYTTFLLITDFVLNGIGKIGNGVYRPLFSLKNSNSTLWIFLSLGFVILTLLVWLFGNKIKSLIEKFHIDNSMFEVVEYKMITIGFPIFTIGGLIFGAIWADISWGRYWAWDPKETWAFITWMVYAFYLHMRFLRGFDGIRSSVISVIGFIITIFTYVGVNLLLSGLHSYGSM
ncbi:MAG: c-type cytochrome biogenesis protein CcsB [Calditerrivibrio sp.]|nr:c-type cytochrome biogenesis protein CcsB [Calditerrivibrio sp.]MCA1932945.1 c-type cytochrome biogenesis protein CcsB [Calditerrivibrio sp.]MCA1980162.1 c-type cytochrome biogenesis protein CcsB [Calditerrivibrio sp.]